MTQEYYEDLLSRAVGMPDIKYRKHPTLPLLVSTDGFFLRLNIKPNPATIRSGSCLWTPGYETGALYLMLQVNGRRILAHRIVMDTFVGECPQGAEVNHKDRNHQNNAVSNLEYCTHQQNQKHAADTRLVISAIPKHIEEKYRKANAILSEILLAELPVRNPWYKLPNGETRTGDSTPVYDDKAYHKHYADKHRQYYRDYSTVWNAAHREESRQNSREYRKTHVYLLVGDKQVWVTPAQAKILEPIKPQYRSLDSIKPSALRRVEADMAAQTEAEKCD